MEMIGNNELVVFGSGSKSPERDVFVHILLKDDLIIEKYNISGFYSNLKKLNIFHDSELNIEATAFRDKQIFLFNRKKNLVLTFNYLILLAYLKGEASFPIPYIQQFSLPKINGIEAGFSGATVLKNESKIIFTVSVENTNNAYKDGEILGSFIGMINITDNTVSPVINFCPIPNMEENLKVESVTVQEEVSIGKTKLILITDDDLGNSILLESILLW
ncbi:hypothetical protein BZARG_2911 [Bizionia argentinensis JUB59]|uniref:Uncharacterized protein n=2 Tax=Bizionia TaxID=283785 RepID=G2EEA1_9FLAO|nr:hypothetical protein [Bizionia argentinensis]EGV43231.1 hypothetical protein BZARG_2911 [Bizionia argentinensis JUB59]